VPNLTTEFGLKFWPKIATNVVAPEGLKYLDKLLIIGIGDIVVVMALNVLHLVFVNCKEFILILYLYK
jgi:hypothetical protein